MRNINRIFLSFFAFFFVATLGYYAYLLSFGTLSFAFFGTEHQEGNLLQIIPEKSDFFIKSNSKIIDPDAIKSSLFFGTQALLTNPTLSGEYKVSVSGELVSVSMDLKKGEVLTLSAKAYNKNKKTSVQLSQDITLSEPISRYPKNLQFQRIGEPRDQTYRVDMYGYDNITPEDIRYYAHYKVGQSCTIQDSWQYMLPIKMHPISPIRKIGQISEMDFTLDYDISEAHMCLIGGFAGNISPLEDRTIVPFVITGSTLQVLSPEIDMKTQLEFRFSSPIYSDTGVLYSSEYISNREQAKIDFLKHLDVNSDIKILPEDIVLAPDRATITLPLEEGKDYHFTLRDLEDIYGRKASQEYYITPQKEPFLSLRFSSDRSIYAKGEKIPVKLYALSTPKNSYSLKLCQVSLDPYSRLERIVDESDLKYRDSVYNILNSKTDAFGCVKKDIVLSGSGYISPFDVTDLMNNQSLKTGLYVLYFRDQNDTASFPRFIKPLVFSVVDTHLTMKVDASGNMLILATDLLTGKPLVGQEITAMRNISRTYIDKYDQNTQTSTKEYLPLSAQRFATGIVLGKTDSGGFLEMHLDSLKNIEGYDDTPYGLSFENWWEYEGRYDSFLVKSQSSDRMGLVVSTWNDGITGFNFGLKESDYSYQNRPNYTSFLNTDRKLYLPGETVHLHAIVRKQGKSGMMVPSDTPFILSVTDSLGKEVKHVLLKTNTYGSLGADFILPSDTSLGSYNVSLSLADSTEYIENSNTYFQVEIFKNPTFTPKVSLKSNDIENDTIKVLKKTENTDPNFPWYSDLYTGDFGVDGIVQSFYYNGSQMKNIPFTYRIYRSEHYSDDYFSDCFWGCYYEAPLEFYTEGTGQIDADGYGIFHVPIHYTSYYSDYNYTAEITIRDPATGEEVTTPSSLLVKLPLAYKTFTPENPLIFTPNKKILNPNEDFSGTFSPTYGKWDASIAGKYHYQILHRSYEETMVDDIRAGSVRVTNPVDMIVESGSVERTDFSTRFNNYPPGEYHFIVTPVMDSKVPEEMISDTLFYISGDTSSLKDSKLRVIPDKTIYQPGETAHVMIQLPFTGSYLLITEEKGGILKKEYTYVTGNTLMRDIVVDDSLLPNAYIGVVALHPSLGSILDTNRSYAVGYGEIISDISSKKSIVTIKTDKETYKNREHVQMDLSLTDKGGKPLQGEITVMVVDESLIRLLGNIDLDIIPKFFQKFPFTMKTSLSDIGIERNRYLSRKGSNGGSGDKGGGGIQIASRTIFKNTAYYNPSVITDPSGNAKIGFDLPDNVTDYRIIAISNTLDSHFGAGEKTIQVRKDYVVEAHAPTIVRQGDTFTISTNAFNSTKKITGANLIIKIGTGSSMIQKQSSIILNPLQGTGSDFLFSVLPSWTGSLSYTAELRDGNMVLDSVTQNLKIAPIPLIENTFRSVHVFTGTSLTIGLPPPEKSTDLDFSKVGLEFSLFRASELSNSFNSLLSYPYGCIEQTIAATLPNLFALNFADTLHLPIDRNEAIKNRDAGLQKILRMQDPSGGWLYWEGNTEPDIHITPYVLRSLLVLRDLGISVPQSVIDQGISYIITNQSSYEADQNLFAESVWTLASFAQPGTKDWWNRIDPTKLDRHGYLAYVYTAHILKLDTSLLDKKLAESMKNTPKSEDYWYWDRDSDLAIYARLLMDQGEDSRAQEIITDILSRVDMSSYYVSTQTKIQIFLSLARDIRNQKMNFSLFSVALRGDGIITDAHFSLQNPLANIETLRSKLGLSFQLTRDPNDHPLFITMNIKDRPKDIFQMQGVSAGGMNLKRSFELIDESRGIDSDGHFIVSKPVDDMIFHRGQLYRVTLELDFDTDIPYYEMTMEDFFPGGWRPIDSILRTESSFHSESAPGTYWDHVESQDDRLLANMSYGYGKKQIYSYYIRPESVGEYLLPPATAYLMYRPSVHSYTQYEKVKVVE